MNLTIAEFNYTKDDGDTSHRRVLILSKPSDSYFGVELDSDADLEAYAEYLKEKEKLEEKLKVKHGLSSFKFRRFKKAGVYNLTEEKKNV